MEEEKKDLTEFIEPSSPDDKEVLANTEAEKQINWSQAIKEKNKKIQELKEELETLKSKKEEPAFNPFVTEDEDTKKIKAHIDELDKQNKDLQKRLDEAEKKQVSKEAVFQVNEAISNLKKKYSDFDEMKVIGRIIQKRGENASPDDLEEAYLAMKKEEELLNQRQEEAKSEGSSVVGVEPQISKPTTYDEAIEMELKKIKTPKI